MQRYRRAQNLTLDPDVATTAKQVALRLGVSFSALVDVALRAELARQLGSYPEAEGIAGAVEEMIRRRRRWGAGASAEAASHAELAQHLEAFPRVEAPPPPRPNEATVRACEQKIRELIGVAPRTLRDCLEHPSLAAHGAEVRIALRRLTGAGEVETSDGKTFRSPVGAKAPRGRRRAARR